MTIAGYGIRSNVGGSWLHTIEPAVWMQSQDDALPFETEVAARNAAEARGLTYYRVEPIAAISEDRGLIRKQGTITWRDGTTRRWAIAVGKYGDDELRFWVPEWGAWENGAPVFVPLGDHSTKTPEAMLADAAAGVGYMPGFAPVVHEFDGEVPPLPTVEGAVLPWWFSPPDNPDTPGLPSSVRVEGGRQVAHIGEPEAESTQTGEGE